MSAVKCHHHGISRLRAEELLLIAKEDGSFLIRDSETIPGAYTLCLLYQGRVHQYRVIPDNNGQIFVQAEKGVQERKFPDLASLVQDYLGRRSRNGLMCALRNPVEVQEVQEDDSEDDEDEDIPPPVPGMCQTRPPPSATSSGSSSGSNQSLDISRKPSPGHHSNESHDISRKPSPGNHSNGQESLDYLPSLDGTHPKLPGGMKVMMKESSPAAGKGRAPITPDRDYTDINDISPENNRVCQYITSRCNEIDLSKCDGSFPSRIQDYRDCGVYKDSSAAVKGETQLPQLRQLLSQEAKMLDRQLESFLGKIDVCRQLFGPITTAPLTGRCTSQDVTSDLDALMDRLVLCKSAILKLERKAIHRLWELSTETQSPSVEEVVQGPPLPQRGPKEQPVIPSSSFEAKLMKSSKLSTYHKVTLKVDIQAGKLFMVRPSKDILDDSNVFNHDKVVQIIKSTSNNCRLDMRIDGHKGKDTIVFDNTRQRESFCQLMQQMKFTHSVQQEVDRLSLFIGTWNMGDESPPWDIHNWLCCQGLGKTRDKTLAVLAHDVYVIGTQESALTEKDWVVRLQRALSECVQSDLQLLSSSTLWGIRLVILIKPQFKNKITHIQQSTVKTGIANTLGNKGAAALSFNFNGTSFCFINCHLTSGWEKNHRRNQNAHDIIKGLNLGTKAFSLFDITNQFHHVFFLGDLNYRIDGIEPVVIIQKIKNEEYKELEQYDQLMNSQGRNECFVGFTEEEITFPPTYRIARHSKDKYEWQKFKKSGIRINAPSWCDRVLVKSYPETYINNTSYGCVDTISTSDHKPIFSSFDVGVINQFAAGTSNSSADMSIIFEEVHAEVRTSSKEQFKLEFFSTILEAPVVSNHSWEFDDPKPCFCCPRWSQAQIPQISPLVQNREFLEDRHILIAVKSADGMESYGEAVVALRSKFGISGVPFWCHLTHLGEATGVLTGKMYVKSKDDKKGRAKKSFELIYMDTDLLFQERETLLRNQKPDFSNFAQIDENRQQVAGHKATVTKTTSLQTGITKIDKTDDTKGGASSEARTRNSYESIWLKKSGNPSPPKLDDLKPLSHTEGPSPPPQANFKATSEADKSRADPAAAPRKPRLGQSSLTPTTVLPVTSPMGGMPNVQNHSDAGGFEYECVSFPGARKVDKNLNIQKTNNTPTDIIRPAKRSGLADTEMPIRDNPLYEKDRDSRSRLSSSSIEAPPMPERKYLQSDVLDERQNPEYDMLRAPASVSQWLADLGLQQYIIQFISQGWDHLDFITDLTEHHLRDMNITDRAHRAKILESTASLRKEKTSSTSV